MAAARICVVSISEVKNVQPRTFSEASGIPFNDTKKCSIPDVDTYKYPQRFSQEF